MGSAVPSVPEVWIVSREVPIQGLLIDQRASIGSGMALATFAVGRVAVVCLTHRLSLMDTAAVETDVEVEVEVVVEFAQTEGKLYHDPATEMAA
jgi:hypothetical protein